MKTLLLLASSFLIISPLSAMRVLTRRTQQRVSTQGTRSFSSLSPREIIGLKKYESIYAERMNEWKEEERNKKEEWEEDRKKVRNKGSAVGSAAGILVLSLMVTRMMTSYSSHDTASEQYHDTGGDQYDTGGDQYY